MGGAVRWGGAVLWGLVPAAGAGIRFGGPKVLARRSDGVPWVALAAGMLRDAGCAEVVVTLGAAADEAVALVPAWAMPVRVEHWAGGLSMSLRAGLAAASEGPADAVLISPVDTPEATPAAARRVVATATDLRQALVQAVYDGVPGHPVLIGRDHWPALIRTATADAGARPYLVANGVREVECGDLWSGADIDERPGDVDVR